MPVKQITSFTVRGEIQTATVTFIVCLTRFRLMSHPFEKLHRIPTGPWAFITVPIPILHTMGIHISTSAMETPYTVQ